MYLYSFSFCEAYAATRNIVSPYISRSLAFGISVSMFGTRCSLFVVRCSVFSVEVIPVCRLLLLQAAHSRYFS